MHLARVWRFIFLSQNASFAQSPSVVQKSKSQCDIRASFATAFRNWRVKNNIPLKKVASDLGLAVSTVDSWELGKRFPTGRNFEMLVDYTGVPPCKLFCVMADKCVPTECLLAMGRKP
jgi:DNA-binding transcriptional regulator YiaG